MFFQWKIWQCFKLFLYVISKSFGFDVFKLLRCECASPKLMLVPPHFKILLESGTSKLHHMSFPQTFFFLSLEKLFNSDFQFILLWHTCMTLRKDFFHTSYISFQIIFFLHLCHVFFYKLSAFSFFVVYFSNVFWFCSHWPTNYETLWERKN